MGIDTLKLGQIITEPQQRDAIHIAVAPVECGDKRLLPGSHVGFCEGSTSVVTKDSALLIGIIDPFISDVVMNGEKCWLFLYPGSITSLRHDWTHPAFVQQLPTIQQVIAGEKAADDKSPSEKWMREWAVRHVGHDYYGDRGSFSEDTAYAFAIEAGHQNHIGPYEDARDFIDDEWWSHWETITGQKGDRGSYFSCSC